MDPWEVFTYIIQGCFTGTGTIILLPQCQWSNHEGYGLIDKHHTTSKYNKARTMCIILGMYSVSSAQSRCVHKALLSENTVLTLTNQFWATVKFIEIFNSCNECDGITKTHLLRVLFYVKQNSNMRKTIKSYLQIILHVSSCISWQRLTHYGLVTIFCDMKLGQHWFR